MAQMKKAWKETGSSLGGAFKNLGQTLINSGKKGVDKAVDWAGKGPGTEGEHQPPQIVEQPVVQPVPHAAQEWQPAQAQAQEAEVVSVAEEIRKLAALRDQGILTEEEFSAKKRELLGL